jgi:O-antigen/teichoic acid export membrane protein
MVKISKSFLKSSLIYTMAGSLPMASALILLPFYTDYLSTSAFGALAIYSTFTLLVQYFTTYSFDVSLYIHFHEFKNEPQKLARFVSSAFVLMILIGIGVGTVLCLAGNFIFQLIFTDVPVDFYPFGVFAVATGIFQALLKVYSNLLQSRERPTQYFWSNAVSLSLMLIFSVGGMHLYPDTLTGPVGGRFLGAFIVGLWGIVQIFREFGFHFDFSILRSSLSFNLYTFVYQLERWVISNLDRILIGSYLLSAAGIYDFALKCLVIIEFVTNGLNSSFFPKVVGQIMQQKEKKSTPEVNRYYHGVIAIVMLLVCFCILTFPWAIETLIRKKDYHATIEYLPYIAAIFLFRAMQLYFAAPYTILKYMKPLPVMYLVVSLVKVGLILLLAEKYLLYGVIAASVVSAALEIILLRTAIGKRFKYSFNAGKMIIAPCGLFVLIFSLEPFFGQTYPYLLHGFYLLACGVLLFWFYRNEIRLINPLQMFSTRS